MNRRTLLVLAVVVLLAAVVSSAAVSLPQLAAAQKPFTLEQILSAPFAANLIAAKKVNRIAWTLDEQGKRNVWVAEGPTFQARRLTSYLTDDGQEISQLSFSEDGNSLVYVRGGEKNPAGQYPESDQRPGRRNANRLGRRMGRR